LVTKGVPFRTAHKIVGTLVARCEAEKKPALAQLSVADFVEAAKGAGANPSGIGQDVYEALGSRNVAKRYRSPGAAGGPPYSQRLTEWKQKLGV
jgi:argininosuccinate lyase